MVESLTNLGVSGGRRLGAAAATGDVLLFLDDDCVVRTDSVVDRVVEAFGSRPELGALALRIVVRGTDRSPSYWLPRLRGRRPDEAGPVTWFAGGAHAIRTSAYLDAGGYDEHLFFGHEESDLAWRILDAGWSIRYDPDLVVEHEETATRSAKQRWYEARNRIWLARRHLPFPLAVIYVAVWLAIQLIRCRTLDAARVVVGGTRAGFTEQAGARRPISWPTVLRMTRLGRPPVI